MHDNAIVEWSADGIEAVVGHHSQEDVLRGAQPQCNVELNHTPSGADGLLRALEIPQRLWNDADDEAEVQEGEIRQEEVHGLMELGVQV